jgi:LPS export ABC transporter protein LptC
VKRSHLRALLLIAVVVGTAMLFLGERHRPRLDELIDISRLSAKSLPHLLQRIRDFRRVVMRDGKKVLEVSASEASYYRDRTAVEIINPRVAFFSEGDTVASLSGKKGILVMDGDDVASVELSQGVLLELLQFDISAQRMVYARVRRTVVAEGNAEIRSPEVELKGKAMTVDLAGKSLTVEGSVDMTLRRMAEPDDLKRLGVPTSKP